MPSSWPRSPRSRVLVQQMLPCNRARRRRRQPYLAAGVLGAVIFIAALSVRPLANRLLESEALVRRQEVDLANLAQLSQYIVQHLRESILVVDAQDRIRLINESAAEILGDANAWPGALLGEVLAAPAVPAGGLAPARRQSRRGGTLRRRRRRAADPAAFRAAGQHAARRRC